MDMIMTQNMKVPVLRFPEFEGEWVSRFLKDLTNRIIVGIATSTTEHYVDKTIDAVPIIRNQNIKRGYFDESDMLYISQKFSIENKNKRIRKGDVIIVRTGSNVGLTCVVPDHYKGAQTFTTLIVSPKKDALISGYFNYLLSSNKGNHQALRLVVGGGKGNLNSNNLKIYPVSFPKIPEQQKIANFLTAIDTKIQQLTKKKALLETYKKGVMQQIFKQEIRFRDEEGKDFPDWEEKRLGEIGSYYNGLTGKTKEDFGSGKPFIIYTQIFNDSKIDIEKFGFVKINKSDKQQKAKYGDIFFTTSSETANEVGFSSVLLDNIEELYLNSFSFGYRPTSLNVLNPKFARFLFRSELFRREVIKLAQGSTRYNMSKVQLMKIKILLPSEDEQLKIAKFLTALTGNIKIEEEKLKNLQFYKKGLLQKMFV